MARIGTIPTLRTWVAGELVTASYLNANIRDTGNFLLSVPVGILRATVTQSIPTSVWTPVNFDTEDIDRDNAHSTVTNTARYTAQTPGYYLIFFSIGFSPNTTGRRAARVRANGADAQVSTLGRDLRTASSAFDSTSGGSGALYLNGTSDYVEVVAFQDSGGSINTYINTDGVPRMQCLWVAS